MKRQLKSVSYAKRYPDATSDILSDRKYSQRNQQALNHHLR